MRLFILLLALINLAARVWPCDVNLFAIISGTSRHDAFGEAVIKLVQKDQNLGSNYLDEVKSPQLLADLMRQWVEFSTAFAVFPPEWARNDKNWLAKFNDLGAIIGRIRSLLPSDPERAHNEMLKFSRRLSLLYELMPMSERSRLLLSFTACFDALWTAFFAQNHADLRHHCDDLLQKCARLAEMVDEETAAAVRVMTDRAVQLRVAARQINAFKTMTLRLNLAGTEGEFIRINEKLSAEIAQTQVENENTAAH